MSTSGEIPQSNYCILTRGQAERDRLDKQFWFHSKYHGRDLVCDSRISIPDDVLFAGVWIRSLAKQVPSSVELYAVDLAPTIWSSEGVPSNVHYSVQSITSLPGDWTSKFDFVNQSLVAIALKRPDWPKALAELYRVLKPGGYVQLTELTTYPPFPKTSPPPEMPDKDILQVMHRLSKMMDYLEHPTIEIPRMLEDVGFREISTDLKPRPTLGKRFGGEHGADALEVSRGAMAAVKDITLLNDGFGIVRNGEEFDVLMDHHVKECEEFGLPGWEYCFITARKPI
uniref:Methyltransferase domain-containing protein n=1 Tax=Moniliophthora roreri TaxID=221103 RepID=A0A0W0GCY2_MONRR